MTRLRWLAPAGVALAAALALGSGGPGGCSSQHDQAPPAVPLPLGTGGMPVRATNPGLSDAIRLHAGLTRGHSMLGGRVLYRGVVWVPVGTRVDWQPPASGGAFSWGALRSGRERDWPLDSVWVEVPLQAFQTGVLSIPGLTFRFPTRRGLELRPEPGRLPVVQLAVEPMLSASDTAADLRPVRGPLRAPWWERVLWHWVALGILAVIAVGVLVWWLRRSRPRVAPQPVRAARPVADPTSEALAALTALRALHLPEHERFAEHAFQLTRILRRYLERRVGVLQPGDTSGELLIRLASSRGRLEADSLQIVDHLLRSWDRVKFARAATNVEQARGSERAVEGLVRRHATPADAAA